MFPKVNKIIMKLGVLFSGGKDSTLALYKALKYHEIACLISIFSENPESYMFHVPNIHIVDLQAEAMEIPLIKKTTHGKKEKELIDLKEAILEAKKCFGIEGVVTGAVRSIYQASRIQKICKRLGLWCFNPLWLEDELLLLEELVEKGFKVIISGVFAYPLKKELLGREIDPEVISLLKSFQERYMISPAGEGGEIETTVLDTPLFKKRIEIVDYSVDYSENRGIFIIKKARLVEK
jgi:ABC transporter with metal-binding/Fe-S-binding domain ATP-binding protein